VPELLSAQNVTVRFGKGNTVATALSGVSVGFDAGTLTVIMGPSGSGKTTLLSALGCLLKPDSGRITLGNLDVTGLSESKRAQVRQRSIGFVFQAFRLLRSLNAVDNVAIASSLRGLRFGKRSRAKELLVQFGLGRKLDLKPDELSGGEKQRVAIARALIEDPPVVLADEPTAALDSTAGLQVASLLRDLAKQSGKTVVVVSHDRRWEHFADRIIYLTDGRVVSHICEEVFECVTH
jgi:putative ABC transport system ATP-binding protein